MPTDQGDTVLLDTHTLLWWHARSARLSGRARERIDAADRLLVSPASCWEVAMLVGKGTVTLDRPPRTWTRDLLSQPQVHLAELSADIAVAAAELPGFHGDPADRFLYATAQARGVPLVSKDRKMRDYAAERSDVAVVW